MYSTYTAVTIRRLSIITVGAESAEEAKEKITNELHKNPSRVSYFVAWKSAGYPMVLDRDFSRCVYAKETVK